MCSATSAVERHFDVPIVEAVPSEHLFDSIKFAVCSLPELAELLKSVKMKVRTPDLTPVFFSVATPELLVIFFLLC